MYIKQLIESGLYCPNCKSKNLRACYHDFQSLDSLICGDCGLRWREDTSDIERWYNNVLKQDSKKDLAERLIWVLHTADTLNKPFMNAESADETEYKKFIKKGKLASLVKEESKI